MVQAWKEYAELCKLSGKWVRKHWKGYTVFCVMIWILTYGYYEGFDWIKDFFRDKFEKKEEES